MLKINDTDVYENIKYPFPDDICLKDIEPYELYFFRNRFGLEYDTRHIFQLCNKQSPYAWLFPIQVYKKIEFYESYKDSGKPFFKFPAYPAFELLKNNTKDFAIEVEEENDNYTIPDFYKTDLYILILHSEKAKTINIESIYDILPHLFYYGYCYIGNKNQYNKIEEIRIEQSIINEKLAKNELKTFGKLSIEPISKSLKNELYIQELFKNLIAQELHPIMRFYLLYQVIELIINQIGLKNNKDKYKEIAERVKMIGDDILITQDIKDLSEMAKKMEVTSEKDRIETLMVSNLSGFSNTLESYPKLNNTNILGNNHKYTTLYEIVYALRNKIVHGYYILKSANERVDEAVKDVNIDFEKFIVDVLIHYKVD